MSAWRTMSSKMGDLVDRYSHKDDAATLHDVSVRQSQGSGLAAVHVCV